MSVRASREERYLLGLDGGQTSTRALLARLSGEVIGRGVGGPIDHFHSEGGREKNRAALHSAIRAAYATASLEPDADVSAVLALTGVQLDAPQAPIVESIVREIVCPNHVRVVPDYVANLAGASAGTPGIVVIAGGGAIAYGVTDGGREALAGGFGYLLGDEGSGYDIGRRAAMAAIRASDGRDVPTLLEGSVKSAFGLSDMRQIIRVVYDAGFGRERLAALTPLVVRAAKAGDTAAAEIMTTAGIELAQIALAVMAKLFAPGQELAVYLSGGVFDAGEVIRRPFCESIAERWSSAHIRSAAHPPVVGALILAHKQATGADTTDPAWLEALEESHARLELVGDRT